MLRGAQLITGSRVGTIIQAIVPNLPFFSPTHSLLALSPISGCDGDSQRKEGLGSRSYNLLEPHKLDFAVSTPSPHA